MTTIDTATRIAYVDGELDEIARRRVERAIAADPALTEAVARDRALRERLQTRFASYAGAPVPDRLRALFDTNIVPITKSSRPTGWRISAPRWAQGATIAATLVLGVALGRQLGTSSPVASRNGALVANGQLAATLDTQLASRQASDAAIRIGLTFRNRAGAICRSFTGGKLQGIACRDEGKWDLVRTATGERAGIYRQAASAALIGEAQEMMAGSPFSAAEEAAAKSRDWH